MGDIVREFQALVAATQFKDAGAMRAALSGIRAILARPTHSALTDDLRDILDDALALAKRRAQDEVARREGVSTGALAIGGLAGAGGFGFWAVAGLAAWPPLWIVALTGTGITVIVGGARVASRKKAWEHLLDDIENVETLLRGTR